MSYVSILWDLEDDPDGNVQHIAEHDVSVEEVEEVLLDDDNSTVMSRSSDNRVTFGWTSTGRYIAVVWEPVLDDPRTIRPVTAYETPPPKGE